MKKKNHPEEKTNHHRKNRKNGGDDVVGNISVVPRHKHEAFHTLFGDKDTQGIADELNNVWIDPEYTLIVTKRQPTFVADNLGFEGSKNM